MIKFLMDLLARFQHVYANSWPSHTTFCTFSHPSHSRHYCLQFRHTAFHQGNVIIIPEELVLILRNIMSTCHICSWFISESQSVIFSPRNKKKTLHKATPRPFPASIKGELTQINSNKHRPMS